MEKELEEYDGKLKVNDITINNLRYADNRLILATSQAELQRIVVKVVRHSEEADSTTDVSKTNIIVFSGISNKCRELENVASIKHLGLLLDDSCTSKRKVRSRIEMVGSGFER